MPPSALVGIDLRFLGITAVWLSTNGCFGNGQKVRVAGGTRIRMDAGVPLRATAAPRPPPPAPLSLHVVFAGKIEAKGLLALLIRTLYDASAYTRRVTDARDFVTNACYKRGNVTRGVASVRVAPQA